MPKRVKMQNYTESKNTSSYILLDHFNAFGLTRNIFFCHKQRGSGGGDSRLCPILNPQGNFTGPNWQIPHPDHVSYKIRLQ